MFYATLALLQGIGRVPSKHAGAIGIFDAEFVRKGAFPRELSQDLHKAFALRQVSDYRGFESPPGEKAEETWRKAARFVEAIKKHLLAIPGGEKVYTVLRG